MKKRKFNNNKNIKIQKNLNMCKVLLVKLYTSNQHA